MCLRLGVELTLSRSKSFLLLGARLYAFFGRLYNQASGIFSIPADRTLDAGAIDSLGIGARRFSRTRNRRELIMKTKLIFKAILTVSAAFALAACGGETNTNTRNANTNANTNVNRAPSPTPTPDCKNANMTREEYEKNKGECEKEKGSSTIGQGIDDSWIWFKTRAALLTTSDLRESTINVDVVNAVITLKGTVATAAQKTKAEQVAKGIDGQKGVKNELKVAPNDSMTNTHSNSNTNTGKNMNTGKK
jgi:hypothetical protein